MDKKKILIYTALLAGGLFFGWFIFGPKTSTTDPQVETKQAEDQFWTCSMHPQIHLPEPGDCPICGMDLIPETAGGSSDLLVFEMTEDAVKLMNIQTTVIGNESNSQDGTIRLSGKIEANETTAASIVTHISGRIEKLYIGFTGEQVYRGQKIASIYSPNLITAQKELLEAQKIKDIQPKLFVAARNKLKYWKITDKQINEILSAKKVKESFGIYADHSGIVSKMRVSVGDYLREGGVLFEIQNLNKLWGVFDVYEANLKNVNIGDLITFTTPSIGGEEFTAKVSFVNPVINAKTRSATVRVELDNSKKHLKPEMFISGTLKKSTNSITQRLLVPKSAIMWTGTRSVVYIKKKDIKIPSFEYREVIIGSSSGDSYFIEKGLEPGDEVVTKGAFVIDASAQLNNQASMMNQLVEGSEIIEKEDVPDYTKSTSKKFKSQLEQVNLQYIHLKNMFVKSDALGTAEEGKKLLIPLKKVEMSLLKGDAHLYWMKKLEVIENQVSKISNSEDIEEQRKSFEIISNSLINSTTAFGASGEVFYIQYCPMAANDKGAYWMSSQIEIRNPYFGDKMLKCGTLEDSLKTLIK